MRKLLLSLCLCVWLPACAQTTLFKVTGDSLDAFKLYIKQMEAQNLELKELLVVDGIFQGEVEKASDGFYILYGNSSQMQMQLPLYLPDTSEECVLPLTLQNLCPQVNLDKDNKALSAFNQVVYADGKYFWMQGENMSIDQILSFLKGYREKADSIAAFYQCSEPVKQYLNLWANTQAYSNYESIPRALGIKQAEIPFKTEEFMDAPQELLNVPMASYFYTSVSMVLQSLPQGGLMSRLDYLYEHYKVQPLREKVVEALLSSYIRRFNYNENFEDGLQELTTVVEKFDLPRHYLNDFKMRRSTVKGARFPEGVKLMDAEGNEVNFSSLKGYNVYIDLWASWCIPCQREIPHLQKLEQELTNKGIKFLSISIDRDVEAWKKKMKQLNLHGLQWHDATGKLAEALNVKGIPFFLIYDKEGNLYRYNAPRPSTGAQLKELLESLQ